MKEEYKKSTGVNHPSYVIAGIASFFVPGLGHLALGRKAAAVRSFVAAVVAWFVAFNLVSDSIGRYSVDEAHLVFGLVVGFLPHVISSYNAANDHDAEASDALAALKVLQEKGYTSDEVKQAYDELDPDAA